MDNYTWENLSCKYILKIIFSYLKVNKALNIIKPNNKMRNILDISLSHYQYYYFCSLYKAVKIESINDILSSPYLEFFPENERYEQVLKYIENRKLFKNENIYLNIDEKSNLAFMNYLKEKPIKKGLNYIIGNIEEKEWIQWNVWNNLFHKWDESLHKNYNESIYNFCSKETIDIKNKILFDYNFFSPPYNIINKNMNKNIVKFLHIYFNKHPLETYNISSFENLEYLSIKLDLFRIIAYNNPINITIILTENQMKNIKTLKIIQSKREYFPITDIIFETENHKRKIFFENLEELYINENLLNKIQFDSKN